MRRAGVWLTGGLLLAGASVGAAPPAIGVAPGPGGLPALRPADVSAASLRSPLGLAPPVRVASPTSLARPALPHETPPEIAALLLALRREVPDARPVSPGGAAPLIERARSMLESSLETLEDRQLVVVVDRNPAVQRLALVLARPDGPWEALAVSRVSTGQGGRKDYYFTPTGVFAHTDAILDFRAEGTYNENNIRGLGLAGMRVWDFGWQWAVKGWRSDGEGGDIRLQMHATDPDGLEQRLGRPASEGCVRVSSAMNRFLDRHGVLDRDYERAAVADPAYAALLRPDRVPTPLAGRLLIVIDSREPAGAPPTAASRPADVVAGPG